MAPRKKRGGKAPVTRKVKNEKKGAPVVTTNPEEDVQTPTETKICDSTKKFASMESIKTTMITRAHKKFGKFRFLIEVSRG